MNHKEDTQEFEVLDILSGEIIDMNYSEPIYKIPKEKIHEQSILEYLGSGLLSILKSKLPLF